MTLRECYEAMGADYDEAINRLRSESMLQRFVLKFLDDGSYKLLCDSLDSGNMQEAFRAAHTIKGMCQNLSFTTLGNSASQLTEDLRSGGDDRAAELFTKVKEDYNRTKEAIESFKAGL